MANENFGFKELYEVVLKATYPMETNGRKIEVGETIAAFDRIQIADFDEKKSFISANGGFDNRARVWWEESKEVKITLSQGVFSKNQLGLLTNAKMLIGEGKDTVSVHFQEIIETDEEGKGELKYTPIAPCFFYDYNIGARLNCVCEENKITGAAPFSTILADYYFIYANGYSTLTIGRGLTNGYLSLEGKMRVKDDISGKVTTGIIRIPKIKLLSDLSMRLGQDAVPQVGRMDAVAIPVGERGHRKLMEIIFLNDDIDADL